MPRRRRTWSNNPWSGTTRTPPTSRLTASKARSKMGSGRASDVMGSHRCRIRQQLHVGARSSSRRIRRRGSLARSIGTIAPVSDDNRLYFRQILCGRDIAQSDPVARQMVNFTYLIGDRATGEAVAVDPAYDIRGLLDVAAAD